MISYIDQTMKTLKKFGEQLKIQLDTNRSNMARYKPQ